MQIEVMEQTKNKTALKRARGKANSVEGDEWDKMKAGNRLVGKAGVEASK